MEIIFSLLFMLSTAFGSANAQKDVKNNSIEQVAPDTGGGTGGGQGGNGRTGTDTGGSGGTGTGDDPK